MRTFVRCGRLFTGLSDTPLADHTVVIDAGRVTAVMPIAAAPLPAPGDTVLDHSKRFVMPGLIDIHTHISYGDAKSQEDIDLYASMEFRALRAMIAAQKVMRAGYTAFVDPAGSGLVAAAVRDAIEVGLFKGPRITAAGRALTSPQGLYDWYPRWIGCPSTSTGVVVDSVEHAIREIRGQIKDGLDMVKFAMDGTLTARGKGLVAAFTQDETTRMVAEVHRLGRRTACHARGAEAALYSARAGMDIIFHASRIDDEAADEIVRNQCYVCPTLALLVNNIEFSRPTDATAGWWPDIQKRELDAAIASYERLVRAGARFLVGSEAGFAVTPYGEWNARELEIMVQYAGISPARALRDATVTNAEVLREANDLGGLAPGKLADMIAVDGDPLADIGVLYRKGAIAAVLKAGVPVSFDINDSAGRHPSELGQVMWATVYDRDTVAAVGSTPYRPRKLESNG
jgi:imidazolonepropionase-like amidohydrolase